MRKVCESVWIKYKVQGLTNGIRAYANDWLRERERDRDSTSRGEKSKVREKRQSRSAIWEDLWRVQSLWRSRSISICGDEESRSVKSLIFYENQETYMIFKLSKLLEILRRSEGISCWRRFTEDHQRVWIFRVRDREWKEREQLWEREKHREKVRERNTERSKNKFHWECENYTVRLKKLTQHDQEDDHFRIVCVNCHS